MSGSGRGGELIPRTEAEALLTYEPAVRSSNPPPFVLARLGMDRSDVQAECRIAVLAGIRRYREVESPTAPEEHYVHRSIWNRMANLIRQAKVRPSFVEPPTRREHQSKSADAGPEQEYLAAERQREARAALDDLRARLGGQRVDALLSVAADVASPLEVMDGVEGRSRYGAYYRLRNRARAILSRTSDDQVSIGEEVMADNRTKDVKGIGTRDLARIAEAVGLSTAEIPTGDMAVVRDALVTLVSGVRVVGGGISPFPPCFSKEYKADGYCRGCADHECCRATAPDFLAPKIEAKVRRLFKPARKQPTVESKKKAAPRKKKRKSRAVKGQRPSHGTPTLAADDDRFQSLTDKRGVFKTGKTDYVRDEQGRRKHYSRPTGSAAMAKALRPGTALIRIYKGAEYECVKHSESSWELVKARTLATGAVEIFEEKFPSIGQLAKRITGNTAWSGAKFFGLVEGK